jgi:uncharacterized surface protein with fasciclin (FAS1) repeats
MVFFILEPFFLLRHFLERASGRPMKPVISFIVFGLVTLGLVACSSTEPPPTKTIAELVTEDPQFSLLEDALTDTELLETLKGPGPFTVFAPTDTAFEAFAKSENPPPPSTIEELKPILLYHVADKKLLAKDLTARVSPIKTLQGTELSYTVEGGKVTLKDGQAKSVNVTKTDIQATNGVIHIIDAVLLLPAPTALR